MPRDNPLGRWKSEHEYSEGNTVCVLRGGADVDVRRDINFVQAATIIGVEGPASAVDPAWRSMETPEVYYYRVVSANGLSGKKAPDPLSVQLLPRAIYLAWPYQLPGDAIPTFSVSLVYTPPVPGAPWQGNTFYPAGSVVILSANDGHFYTALTGGFSAAEPNEPSLPVDVPPTIRDGNLFWLDSGTSTPPAFRPRPGRARDKDKVRVQRAGAAVGVVVRHPATQRRARLSYGWRKHIMR